MKFSVVISQTSLVVISQTITVVFSQTSQAIFSKIFTFKKFFQCSAPEVSAPLLPAAHAADVTGARAAVRSAAPPPQTSRKRSSFLPLQGRGLTGGMGHLRQSGELPGCRCKQDYHPFLSDSPAHANDLFDVRQNRDLFCRRTFRSESPIPRPWRCAIPAGQSPGLPCAWLPDGLTFRLSPAWMLVPIRSAQRCLSPPRPHAAARKGPHSEIRFLL